MPAKPLRTALGSLIIQKQYGYSDRELITQQQYIYDNHTHSVKDRIVSISQAYIRPIVRDIITLNNGTDYEQYAGLVSD